MKDLLVLFAARVRESFWLLPLLMLAGSIAIAVVALGFNPQHDAAIAEPMSWLFQFSAQGSRSVLMAIAGSMITVAGVVFSITVVVLTLASSQYGPRLIRNFIRDRMNQFAVGTFIATFMYCIIVLGAIDDPSSLGFVPQLAVNLGVVFTLFSLMVLVFYLHHVASSIRPEVLLDGVGRELLNSIDRYVSEWRDMKKPEHDIDGITSVYSHSVEVTAPRSGYVQAIPHSMLVGIAQEHDTFIEFEIRAGHFVIEGAVIGRLWYHGETACDTVASRIGDSVVIGHIATPTQDLEFAIRQLVEIAVRALSPGINDPFTAIACIDRLAAGLARLADNHAWTELWSWCGETPRLRVNASDFDDVMAAALNQLRQYGAHNIDVGIALLDRLRDIYTFTNSDAQRGCVRAHADDIAATLLEHCELQRDRDTVRDRTERLAALDEADAR